MASIPSQWLVVASCVSRERAVPVPAGAAFPRIEILFWVTKGVEMG